ncbi:MAG TPA: hypothetical protein GX714_09920 [Chloroflexi bacterium]|nr:hypothetical protein [Chloroflexota bacterium]
MIKLDVRKQLKHLYAPSATAIAIVDVPPMRFLMVDGAGNPNTSPAFQDATQALYGVAYAIKFAIKRQEGIDWTVLPLEGLWWAEDMSAYTGGAKDDWLWRLMIMQPEPVTEAHVSHAVEEVRRKKGFAALENLRFETYHEGLAAQVMHIGPYDSEAPTVARLHAFIRDQGYALRGLHHEIYIGDPRRTAPDKLRTVLRQPIAPKA